VSKGRKRRDRRQGKKSPGSQAALAQGGFGSLSELKGNALAEENLHPSLRGKDLDAEIDVIITTEEGRPDGAGALLGTLNRPMVMEDGTPVAAGARVWQNLRLSGESQVITSGELDQLSFEEHFDAGEITVGYREQDELHPRIIKPGPSGHIVHGDPEETGKGRLPEIPAAFRRPDQPLPARYASGANQAFGERGGGTRLPTGPQTPAESDALLRGANIDLGLPRTLGESRTAVAGTGAPELAARHAGATARADEDDIVAALRRGRAGLVPGVPLPDEVTVQEHKGYSEVTVEGVSEESARFARVLEAASPGLTARLAAGVGREELNRLAPEIARALTAAHRREEALKASHERARQLIANSDPRHLIRDAAQAQAIPVRTSWTADQVLDMHAWLARHYASGSGDLADYLGYLIRDSQAQWDDPDRSALMFWPADLSQVPAGPDEGAQFAGIIAHSLREARTYQVTAPMVARMREVFDRIGLGIAYLDAGELPGHAGFAWLDRPWVMLESSGYFMPFRALSWEKVTVAYPGPDGRMTSVDAARVILWTLISDDVAFGRWDDPRRADRAASLTGQLVPQHISVIPFDRRFTVNSGFEAQGEAMIALIHILWAYLVMELTATRSTPAASPHTARRAQKSLKHGSQVHVITLRRITYISDELPGHRDVSRTCKWWVADFHRHIDPYTDEDGEGRRRRHEAVPAGRTGYADDDDHDICAVCLANGQTIRITPVRGHIRGPSWLPLKQPSKDRTLHRLSR